MCGNVNESVKCTHIWWPNQIAKSCYPTATKKLMQALWWYTVWHSNHKIQTCMLMLKAVWWLEVQLKTNMKEGIDCETLKWNCWSKRISVEERHGKEGPFLVGAQMIWWADLYFLFIVRFCEQLWLWTDKKQGSGSQYLAHRVRHPWIVTKWVYMPARQSHS